MIKTAIADFSDSVLPGKIAEGEDRAIINSVEVSNTTEEDIDFELVRAVDADEYMQHKGTIEAGNYAVFFVGMTVGLPEGHVLFCRTDKPLLKVVANMVTLLKKPESP